MEIKIIYSRHAEWSKSLLPAESIIVRRLTDFSFHSIPPASKQERFKVRGSGEATEKNYGIINLIFFVLRAGEMKNNRNITYHKKEQAHLQNYISGSGSSQKD
jgi:hypothetical protein